MSPSQVHQGLLGTINMSKARLYQCQRSPVLYQAYHTRLLAPFCLQLKQLQERYRKLETSVALERERSQQAAREAEFSVETARAAWLEDQNRLIEQLEQDKREDSARVGWAGETEPHLVGCKTLGEE